MGILNYLIMMIRFGWRAKEEPLGGGEITKSRMRRWGGKQAESPEPAQGNKEV